MSDAANQGKPEAPQNVHTSDEVYQELFLHAADGIFIADSQLRYVDINPRGTELTGYSREEFLDMSVTDLIPYEDLSYDPIPIDDLRQGKIVTKERRLLRKDGSLLLVEISARLLPTGNLMSIVRDITERKRHEAQMLLHQREQVALQAMGNELGSSISLDQTSTAALRLMLDAVQPDMAFLFLREGDRLVLKDVQPPESRQLLGVVPEHRVGECVCGLAVRDGRPMYSRDIETDLRCTWEECKRAGIKSFAALPVGCGQEIIGVIGLASLVERDFEAQADFLETLASQVSVSLNNALLYSIAQEEIVARRRAEEYLKKSGEKLRLFFERQIVGMAITSPAKGWLEVNDTLCRMLGYSATELTNMTWAELTYPDDLAVDLAQFNRLLSGEIDEYTLEKRFIRKDGRIITTDLSVACVRHVDGTVEYVLAIVKDITKHKRAEEIIIHERNFSIDIINTMPGMFYMFDDQGKLFRWNKMFQEISGYFPEELLGKNVLDFFTEEHKGYIASQVQKVFTEGDSFAEAPFLSKNGNQAPYYFNGRLATFDGRKYLLGVGIDISERKKSEAEKENLQAQLLQAQKMESVGRLAGGVAHDFNNMLSAILGHTELALELCEPATPIAEHLQVTRNAALRSADLTRQLLAFARKQTIAPRILDLNDIVSSMLKMLMRLIGEDIDLVWKPAANLGSVKMDPSQLDQILANLCINARDAISGVGKLTIETENIAFDSDYCALHRGYTIGEYVLLAVSDDGCGMEKKLLDYIFEPFFTTKELGKGTGLGLATVYGIVKQNNGFINVYSEPGKGTTFKIYLPRCVGDSVEPISEQPEKTPCGQGEMILFVEDEAVVLNMGKVMLERLGYTVLIATTPQEALLLAKENIHQIRLLITDVVMPEMNGRELSRLILAMRPSIQCLFTSGYTANVIAHHGILDEGVQFLQKPFSLKDLGCRVHESLAKPKT